MILHLLILSIGAAVFLLAAFFYRAAFVNTLFEKAAPLSNAPAEIAALADHLFQSTLIGLAGLLILFTLCRGLRKHMTALTQKPTLTSRIFTFLALALFIYIRRRAQPLATTPLEPEFHAIATAGLLFLQRWFYGAFAATFLTGLVFLILPEKNKPAPNHEPE